EYLRKEGVEAHIVVQQAAKVEALLVRSFSKALNNRGERCIQFVLRAPGVEGKRDKAVNFILIVEVKIRQPGLQIVEQVRVGTFRKQRLLVVVGKCLLYLFRLVREIKHHRLFLSWIGAIEPRERLHGIDS